eukprot:GFUD01041707.1.p1 GENE.GFUD01041707.1~~GFUD01041707.1.p1  ORF type:complete len:207 (-),score=106.55 GFUD01041707.1:292-912(-)
MESTSPPMIVNNTLTSHPLISLLASHFRAIQSASTPPDTLQFPSYHCSCLVLDTNQTITQALLDTCLNFMSSNTNPFILLTPSIPGTSSPHSVTSLSQHLTTQLVPLSMKTPLVVATWITSQALTTVVKLVQLPADDLTDQLGYQMSQAGQSDLVVALTESGLCKDRVDSLLLLCQVERFNCLARGEKDIPEEVMRWLEEDQEVVE